MFFPKMWKAWNRRVRSFPAHRSQRRQMQQRWPLFLEPLEDRTLLSAWTALGPAPVLGEGLAGSTNSGRITSIAADRNNASVVYVATSGGGIWKTTDAQDATPNWTPLTDNIPGTTDSMGAIAIAPTNSSVLYAGTGDANNSSFSNYGEGILVSSNGGSSWMLENPEGMFTGLTVSKIAVDPTNAGIAYAACGNIGFNKAYISGTGVYMTTDGGAHWKNTTESISTNVIHDSFTDVVIDPNNSSILYAAVGQPFGAAANGIYQGTVTDFPNHTINWQLLSGFPNGANVGRIALAISNDGTTLYALASNPLPAASLDVVEDVSTAAIANYAGTSWNNLTTSTISNLIGGGSSNIPATGAVSLSITVDPTNSSTVYLAGSTYWDNVHNLWVGSVYESANGGPWTPIGTDDSSLGVHADIHALTFDANNHLLLGGDGGIYRKDIDPNNANGFLWTDLNGDLNTVQFYGVSINPSNGNILGGAQDHATSLYTANAGTWTVQLFDGDGGPVSFASSTLAYAASYGSDLFSVSTDGGNSWKSETSGLNGNDPSNFFPSFTVDPSNPDRVLLGTNEIYQNTNANSSSSTWTQLTTVGQAGWNSKGNPVDALGWSADANTIYAATGGTSAKGSQIFVRTGSGPWIERDLPSGVGRVNQILVDPNNAQTAYAVVSTFGGGHVFMTTNGGPWIDISGNLPDLPTWSIQLDAADNILYVGNDQGVYYSTDSGQTWNSFGTGLPNAQVFSLDYSSTLNDLVAGTYGRGAWEISTTNATGTPPAVTASPADQTVTSGGTAKFTASASGNPAPTAQWQVSKDGGNTWTNIANPTTGTTSTLTLTTIAADWDGYEFEAVFTNGVGAPATTTAALLTVQFAPTVTTQPTNQTVTAGSTVAFTASVSSNPTATAQWQVSKDGGNTWSNIANAVTGNSVTLTLSNVTADMNGYEYEAVYTNAIGTTTTSGALLTVNPLPSPPPPSPVASSPPPTPSLNVPPLLALLDSLLGAAETVNADGTATLTDSLFGIALLVANFDHSGHLVSVTMLGIDVTFLFG